MILEKIKQATMVNLSVYFYASENVFRTAVITEGYILRESALLEISFEGLVTDDLIQKLSELIFKN